MTSGWDAIDRALRNIYGDAQPRLFGTVVKWSLGGPDPLDGVSVYEHEDHWHLVSYGLSELYTKESDDAEVSGYGFELTFRLRRREQDEPPSWAINFMQNLARYVFSTGNVFAAGHHLDANGPIAMAEKTELTAVSFAEDPELPAIDTPHGRVAFVQIVGITRDEYDAIRQWDSEQFHALMRERSPLLVTDLERPCMMRDEDVALAVERGIERDGSSMGELNLQTLSWKKKRRLTKASVEIEIGASAAKQTAAAMTSRVLRGRPLLLIGPEQVVRFVPAESSRWFDEDDMLTVEVAAETASAIATELQPKRGTYRSAGLPTVSFRVVPTMGDADRG